ncbi:MAG: lytic transglycosylase domain-containing protein [Caulobacteraceae bacterium]|nr:lytic transglycosylase domain-containing protein [Caulobacteraceae bacterium]
MPLGGASRAEPLAPPQGGASGPYAPIAAEAARRFGLPEAWILAVMRAESGGAPHSVSAKGALGLMQLMPGTWTALRARLGLGDDVFDPHDNIIAGAAFLRELLDRYGSPGFLAAYNAGPARYEAYRAGRLPLPAETRAYVAAVLPRIGADGAVRATFARLPAPLAWTGAPLFAPRAADARDGVFAGVTTSVAPTSNGLFAPLSSAGGARRP